MSSRSGAQEVQNDIVIHPKFLPLIQTPHAFANIYGGRMGMKSTMTHQVALLEAIRRPMRVCGARETMSSIKDSSHKLLADTIYQYGMSVGQNGPYEVQERRILRRDGDQIASEFLFVGIREDVRNNKSLYSIDLSIVEEAGTVSEDSWEVFIPTVMGRKEGSRLWAIWNPEFTTDPTYKLFMLNPPSNTIHIHTTYLDNPWLTDSAWSLAEDCKRTDPKKYRHIWLGEPITDVEGAIYAAELKQCEAEGRICEVPYDRSKPVDTAWDLGYGDPTCIWFVQAVGGFLNFIDYYTDSQKDISAYIIALQNRGYVYGTDWLPHDSVDNIIHKRLMGGGDLTQTIPNLMRKAGRKVDSSPKLLNSDSLNVARSVFPVCRFDAKKCADGIHGLRHYQWDRTEQEEGKRKPLHDFACFHPDTLVLTDHGKRRIMDLPNQGERILTPCGWRPYQGPMWTRKNAQLVQVEFADGTTVKCTPEHLFLTESGWKSASSLLNGSLIQSALTPSRSTLMALFGGFGRLARILATNSKRDCIPSFGKLLSGLCRPVAMFTMLTKTRPITDCPIWNAFQPMSTTAKLTPNGPSPSSAKRQDYAYGNGINQKKADYGTFAKQGSAKIGKNGSALKSLARSALTRFHAWLENREFSKNTAPQYARPLLVKSVTWLQERSDVCCIAVDDGHWFSLENGAVVHNSHPATAFWTAAVSIKPNPTQINMPKPGPRRTVAEI